MELRFPADFLWGAATAAHQVEGGNSNSDWWEWELRAGTPVAEPSGDAIDHYARYLSDIELLAGLGFGMYRFSVEWARIEPEEGSFDRDALDHYRSVIEAVRSNGMEPMVTLHHFTLPRWFAARGGWMSPQAPDLFARYCRQAVGAFGDSVGWYCTINEPGGVAFGGYLGALGWPPGTTTIDTWHTAIEGLRRALSAGRVATKEIQPDSRVGATHSMAEWESNNAGRPLMEYLRRHLEDVFLEACDEDDFIGVQTYTRIPLEMPVLAGPAVKALIGWAPFRRAILPRLIRSMAVLGERSHGALDGSRLTDMGYEYRPQAVAATVRRVAQMFPGKDIIVTEHGIATGDDDERIEFITEGLQSLRDIIGNGIPLRGYLHWSAFDNFEWTLGYRMRFGLIAVDRATQERTPKPSAHYLGEIARTGVLSVP